MTPWTAARQASLSITSSWSLHKLMSIKSVMLSNHLILYRPLLLLMEKPKLWLYGLWGQSDVFVFTILSRFVKAFPPRSKCLLVLWLQSPSTVILEPKKIKSAPVSTFSPSICHEVMGLNAMILVFWMLSFKPVFSLSSFTFIKRLFSAYLLSAIRVISSAIWGCWYFSQQPWFQLVIHVALHFAWYNLHIS